MRYLFDKDRDIQQDRDSLVAQSLQHGAILRNDPNFVGWVYVQDVDPIDDAAE